MPVTDLNFSNRVLGIAIQLCRTQYLCVEHAKWHTLLNYSNNYEILFQFLWAEHISTYKYILVLTTGINYDVNGY